MGFIINTTIIVDSMEKKIGGLTCRASIEGIRKVEDGAIINKSGEKNKREKKEGITWSFKNSRAKYKFLETRASEEINDAYMEEKNIYTTRDGCDNGAREF
jgi:hypothetical protein